MSFLLEGQCATRFETQFTGCVHPNNRPSRCQEMHDALTARPWRGNPASHAVKTGLPFILADFETQRQ